ncbi:MAG: hypothetical protein IT353_07330 [Gemmatimonadaceae bacterium]|nr:hypothetical protein [Gemmatimonadaceae bacterium]
MKITPGLVAIFTGLAAIVEEVMIPTKRPVAETRRADGIATLIRDRIVGYKDGCQKSDGKQQRTAAQAVVH